MAVSGNARGGHRRGLTVLVIDDDVELCQLLSEYLIADGYLVESRAFRTAGAERALGGPPAIIVLDVMLPDIKGFEVLRRLRAVLADSDPDADRQGRRADASSACRWAPTIAAEAVQSAGIERADRGGAAPLAARPRNRRAARLRSPGGRRCVDGQGHGLCDARAP